MTERLSDLPPTATLDDARAWLERENARYLARHAATQADHERLVRMLGELVIESRKGQLKEDQK